MKQRPVHMVTKIRGDGAASALCFDKPRAIDMKRASWTTMWKHVTCAKCLAREEEQAA